MSCKESSKIVYWIQGKLLVGIKGRLVKGWNAIKLCTQKLSYWKIGQTKKKITTRHCLVSDLVWCGGIYAIFMKKMANSLQLIQTIVLEATCPFNEKLLSSDQSQLYSGWASIIRMYSFAKFIRNTSSAASSWHARCIWMIQGV